MRKWTITLVFHSLFYRYVLSTPTSTLFWTCYHYTLRQVHKTARWVRNNSWWAPKSPFARYYRLLATSTTGILRWSQYLYPYIFVRWRRRRIICKSFLRTESPGRICRSNVQKALDLLDHADRREAARLAMGLFWIFGWEWTMGYPWGLRRRLFF